MEDGQHLITASRNINPVCPKRSKQKLLNRQRVTANISIMLEKAWFLPTHSPREGGTDNWPPIHFNSGAKEGGWLGWPHASVMVCT